MYTKSMILKCLIYFFLVCVGCEAGVRTTHARVNSARVVSTRNIVNNNTNKDASRGFGSILSIGKVLNFFPVGGGRECQPEGYNVAKSGICVNPYDCRQREGRAAGDCAHGLGVCCVFEVSCGSVVQNNLTYFMSPGFPEIWNGDRDCDITIQKTHEGITQLRIDFVHFTVGQPNRTTGECDEDAMVLGDGDSKFTLCGQNHGQHLYYTMSSGIEARDDDELPSTVATKLSMRMRATEMPRLWLMRLAQMPIANAAPHECLQYHTANNGTIKTFNYASNGRHLANQEYRSCIRKNPGFCAIRYTPCDYRSFRIDGNRPELGPLVYGGGPVTYGAGSMPAPLGTTPPVPSAVMDQQVNQTSNETAPQDQMPSQSAPSEDEIEGSGSDPMVASDTSATKDDDDEIWNYIVPSLIWRRSSKSLRGKDLIRKDPESRTLGWSPYTQHFDGITDYKFKYHGYGTFGTSLFSYGRVRCQDRISIPCENEFFVSSSTMGAGVCDPHHCGNNFCSGLDSRECRVESSVTPFAVSVHFGPPTPKASPEDNIGACLRYTQIPC